MTAVETGTLIPYLTQMFRFQAWIAMGKVVHPVTGKIERDLAVVPAGRIRLTGAGRLVLDRLMIGRGFIRYWTTEEMKELLQALGFEVFYHEMVDWLPYPHVIFIARKITHIDHEAFQQEYIRAHLEKYRTRPSGE